VNSLLVFFITETEVSEKFISQNGGCRGPRDTSGMAQYWSWRRTGYAIDCIGTVMYASSDVGQCRPLFRMVCRC